MRCLPNELNYCRAVKAVLLHLFITLVIDVGERTTSSLGKRPGTPLRREVACLCWELDHEFLVIWPVV
jgi:hypothetical protein